MERLFFLSLAVFGKFVVKIQRPILTSEIAILCIRNLFVALFSKIMASVNVITKSIPFSSLEKQQSLKKEPSVSIII